MQTSLRTAHHPSGAQIEFHPEPHHYLHAGDNLPSVTRLIHQWFPEFDADTVAKKKAEREGGSYEALLREWSRKRDDAASFGSKVHSMAEKMILENNDQAADDMAQSPREQTYLVALKEALRRIRLAYEFVETEKIVFSPSLRVAGTIDLLLRNRLTNEYVIADWKTNREIKHSAYRQERGLGPCLEIENCNFNHYSLQVSSYAELLMGEGYLPQTSIRGVLLHLVEKAGHVTCAYVKTKDYSFEAKSILSSGVKIAKDTRVEKPAELSLS
jgi:ATP-dependent exoDNAse (exonuclease V) beta subunit